ncbi:MAG TPA: MFS transporter [Methylomirabilota bacterium]|nr:MFS transporter [Methylomirabilota bacterium]
MRCRRTLEPMAPGDRRTVPFVLAAKATRTFCYGYLGVLLPVYLDHLGVGPRGIGVAVALTLAASAGLTVALRRPVERLGGRAVLVALAGLIVVAGALLATARSPAWVVLAAMLGNVAVSTGETGPFLSIEQVLVARAAPRGRLTQWMSAYYLVGYAAAGLGALAVAASTGRGAPAGVAPYGLLFWVFAASGALQAALYAQLPPTPPRQPERAGGRLPSSGLIYRIAVLFALDSFAGGFVLQSLMVYWLHVRFDLSAAALGSVFFGTQVLTVCSLLIAASAARHLGLVNTMVFSHLASNVLLILMGLAPTAALAVGLLLARALLSQMDVPTRQTFLMLVVGDAEREAAATVTNAGRTVSQAVSPALTGYVMQALALSAPFLLGGGLKIVYDLLLYGLCRRAGLTGAGLTARERGGSAA